MKQKKIINMTEGRITPSLIAFALPLVAGSIFQQLYNTADMMFVGNLVGKTAAAAVGASGTLVTCLIGLFTGIATGTGVAIAQAAGAQDKEAAQKLLHSAAAFSVAAGILLTLVGEVAAQPILRLLNTPDAIMADAVSYIRLYFLGMFPMILYNVGAGVLRACGDSQTPFRILAVGGFLNVAVDALMIGALHLEVEGAAIATTISQTFSAVAVVIALMRGNDFLRLRFGQIRFHGASLKKILHFGLPAGIQSMLITLSNIVLQYFINGYGEDAVAAFSTYFRLESFAYLPVLAFGQAATTFAGQNLGAGQYDRIRKGTLTASAVSMLSVAAIAFTLLGLGPVAIGWFVKDEQVSRIGMQIITVSFPFYWLNSLIEVLGGTIRGIGRSLTSMIIVLISLGGCRLVIAWLIENHLHSIRALSAVYPITWTIAVILYLVVLVRYFRSMGRS